MFPFQASSSSVPNSGLGQPLALTMGLEVSLPILSNPMAGHLRFSLPVPTSPPRAISTLDILKKSPARFRIAIFLPIAVSVVATVGLFGALPLPLHWSTLLLADVACAALVVEVLMAARERVIGW